MVWFWTFQSLTTLVFVGAVYGVFRLRKDKLDHIDEWLLRHWKKLLSSWGVVFIIMTIVMIKPLWNTATCQFEGLSMNTEMTYSWYKSQCLMKTKTGAWLPININRDAPEGDHNVEVQ